MSQEPSRLLNRNFVLLWCGRAVSNIGTFGYTIAMLLWVYQATESASIMASAMVAGAIPGILLSPIGGLVADNLSRRKIIIVTDVINGLVMLGLTWLYAFHSENVALITGGMIVVAAISGSMMAFFMPAITAAIPDLVPRADLQRANSLMGISSHLLYVVGASGGMVVYEYMGPFSLLLFNGISFMVSAFSELFIVIPQEFPKRVKLKVKERFLGYWQECKEGFLYIRRHDGLFTVMLGMGSYNFFSTPFRVLLPVFLTTILILPPQWLGYMNGSIAAGATIASIILISANFNPSWRKWTMISVPLMVAIGYGSFAFIIDPYVICVIYAVLGLASVLFDTNAFTLIQTATPPKIRGRVFSVLGALFHSLTPLAMALSGLVIDLFKMRVDTLFGILGVILVVVGLVLATRRKFITFVSMDFDKPQPWEVDAAAAETNSDDEDASTDQPARTIGSPVTET